MVRVQDERDIERLDRLGLWVFAIQQVEKMRGLAEILPDGRQRLPLARPVKIGGNDPDLGRDVQRAQAVLVRVYILIQLGIVKPEHRDGGADDIHGARVFRRGLDEIEHPLGQSRRQRRLCSRSVSSVRFGRWPCQSR